MNETTNSTINELIDIGTNVLRNVMDDKFTNGLTLVHLRKTHRLSDNQSANLRQVVLRKCDEYAKKYKNYTLEQLGRLPTQYEYFEIDRDILGYTAYMCKAMNEVSYRGYTYDSVNLGNLCLLSRYDANFGAFTVHINDDGYYRETLHEIVFNADGSVDLIEYEPVQLDRNKKFESFDERLLCWQQLFKAKLEDAFAKMKYVEYSTTAFKNTLWQLQVRFISA